MGKVKVVNVKGLRVGDMRVWYVGRRCNGWEGSVLGNKFKVGVDGSREEVIEKYRVWLWGEVKKGLKGEGGKVWEELCVLRDRVREGKEVVLGCWCVPLGCHGEVIRGCVLWLVKKEEV